MATAAGAVGAPNVARFRGGKPVGAALARLLVGLNHKALRARGTARGNSGAKTTAPRGGGGARDPTTIFAGVVEGGEGVCVCVGGGGTTTTTETRARRAEQVHGAGGRARTRGFRAAFAGSGFPSRGRTQGPSACTPPPHASHPPPPLRLPVPRKRAATKDGLVDPETAHRHNTHPSVVAVGTKKLHRSQLQEKGCWEEVQEEGIEGGREGERVRDIKN